MINPRPLLSGQLHPHSLSNHAQAPHVFSLAVQWPPYDCCVDTNRGGTRRPNHRDDHNQYPATHDAHRLSRLRRRAQHMVHLEGPYVHTGNRRALYPGSNEAWPQGFSEDAPHMRLRM